MVKQLTLILFSLFLCVTATHAQTVEWSNQQKLKSKTNYTKIVCENPTGIYIVRSRTEDFSRDLIIEKYKSNLALENSRELDLPHNTFVEHIVPQDDGILIVASRRNDSLPKIDIICWKINATLDQNRQEKLLAQIDANSIKNNSKVYFQPSVNRANYSMCYFTYGNDKNESTFHLIGFDVSCNQTYSKTFTIKYSPDDIVISGFECDNEGNTYLLADFPKAGVKKLKNVEQRDFNLYSYNKLEDKTLQYQIAKDSTIISDIGLVINNYKKTVCVAGLYADDNSNKVMGTFVYSVDAATSVLQYKSYELLSANFTSKIISNMLNESGTNLTDLYIRKLIPRSDGGCTIIAEKFYETRQTYTYYANGFPQTASRVMYNYDEVIVISKNGEGKTQFQDFIKKKQSSMNDGGYYSSFILLNANDKLAFIYNPDISEESDVLITSINPLGQLDTKILIKAMSYYVTLMPSESKQISANASIICTLKDRRFTLMKLTY